MSYQPENPSSDLGFYAQAWLAREFQAIKDNLDQLKVGRTGLTRETPIASTALITGTPAKISAFDSQLLPEFDGESNLANATLKVARPGLWFIAVKGVVSIVAHTSNNTRGLLVELYNETKAIRYKVIDFASIARYATIVDYDMAIPVFISQDLVGDDLAIYVSSTTTSSVQITSVDLLLFEFVLLDGQ